jgi:hypothetical protein
MMYWTVVVCGAVQRGTLTHVFIRSCCGQKTHKTISVTFDTGKLYEKFSTHFNVYLDWAVLLTHLYNV